LRPKSFGPQALGRRSQSAAAALALAVLLLCLSAGLALASDPGPDSKVQELLVPDSAAALDVLTQESVPIATDPQTDPAAAEELPHSGLARSEAEDLLLSVFPSVLAEQAGVFSDLDVEQFHSDHVAVVAPEVPGDEPGLLSSLLPLRTETEEGTKEAVDLDLEERGADLQPANPLVQVQLPGHLDEGIGLPEHGITIHIPDSADRSASVVSDAAAFYPNIAADSDLTIVPTPTGVETLTQLRSADAPTDQRLNLTMPAGTTLKGTDDGGAMIVRDGEPLVIVHAPTALDAEGSEVQVTMEPSEGALTLAVTPPEDAAYPILVDPIFESYSWMNNNSNTGIYSDWRPFSSNEALFKPSWIGVWNQTMHASTFGRTLALEPGVSRRTGTITFRAI
jgi:hypothetical protein